MSDEGKQQPLLLLAPLLPLYSPSLDSLWCTYPPPSSLSHRTHSHTLPPHPSPKAHSQHSHNVFAARAACTAFSCRLQVDRQNQSMPFKLLSIGHLEEHARNVDTRACQKCPRSWSRLRKQKCVRVDLQKTCERDQCLALAFVSVLVLIVQQRLLG